MRIAHQKVREGDYNATITVDKNIEEMVAWIKPQVKDLNIIYQSSLQQRRPLKHGQKNLFK